MSTLKVDSLVEKTSGNGVHIAGHVVQVVSNKLENAHTTTSGSYTGIVQVDITPKFANSKLYITGYVSGAATNNCRVTCFRDSTNLITTNTSRTPAIADFYEDQWDGVILIKPFEALVDASNTNQTTFAFKAFTTGTFYINTPRDTSNSAGRTNGISSITVMEIAQ